MLHLVSESGFQKTFGPWRVSLSCFGCETLCLIRCWVTLSEAIVFCWLIVRVGLRVYSLNTSIWAVFNQFRLCWMFHLNSRLQVQGEFHRLVFLEGMGMKLEALRIEIVLVEWWGCTLMTISKIISFLNTKCFGIREESIVWVCFLYFSC